MLQIVANYGKSFVHSYLSLLLLLLFCADLVFHFRYYRYQIGGKTTRLFFFFSKITSCMQGILIEVSKIIVSMRSITRKLVAMNLEDEL